MLHTSLSLVNFWNMPPTQCLAVTNGRFKYIYYWYEGEGMKPTEELYDLKQDPLEMQNLSHEPNHKATLERMQKQYDSAVAHIREHAVPDNRYEHYGTLLDRSILWQGKKYTYKAFFDAWVTTMGSWRGGKWFEDLDLSAYPEEVTLRYGKPAV
jgi:hypothetical protein